MGKISTTEANFIYIESRTPKIQKTRKK